MRPRLRHHSDAPSRTMRHCRIGSPPGGSTLITLGAEIGQQGTGERSGQQLTEFEHADTVQRTGVAVGATDMLQALWRMN